MDNEPPVLDYEVKSPVSRAWRLSRPVWLLIAGFCGFVEFAGWFSTNGRVNGWGDLLYIIAFAALGLVALANAVRPVKRPPQRGWATFKLENPKFTRCAPRVLDVPGLLRNTKRPWIPF